MGFSDYVALCVQLYCRCFTVLHLVVTVYTTCFGLHGHLHVCRVFFLLYPWRNLLRWFCLHVVTLCTFHLWSGLNMRYYYLLLLCYIFLYCYSIYIFYLCFSVLFSSLFPCFLRVCLFVSLLAFSCCLSVSCCYLLSISCSVLNIWLLILSSTFQSVSLIFHSSCPLHVLPTILCKAILFICMQLL
jgi:hypothetical protein